ncbi:hypothetical protein CTRI78_v002095 [Colletotrichum trifolii]|uniref:Uncharacterized protein n=1 Tax=Colletotrichum trifolii TaxID=5466 RepID=A0A4R8RNK2_COLTR|nr:hypothetical protein CTRI78_v002095 [Colletotrichum trifolii]
MACSIRSCLLLGWLFLLFSQHASSAALPLEKRDPRPVRAMRELRLAMREDTGGYYAVWRDGPGGDYDLLIEARVDEQTNTLYRRSARQFNLKTKVRTVTAREAMLSFWKRRSTQPLESIRHIVYNIIINQETLDAIQHVVDSNQPRCDEGWCRVKSGAAGFQHLVENSPHAKGSIRIIDDFVEFSNHYISSFDWQDTKVDKNPWFRVNYQVRQEQH